MNAETLANVGRMIVDAQAEALEIPTREAKEEVATAYGLSHPATYAEIGDQALLWGDAEIGEATGTIYLS